MHNVYFYETDKGVIVAKKFTENSKQRIIFIDYETDGLKISYSIINNFSKKNIELFLQSKFKYYKLK